MEQENKENSIGFQIEGKDTATIYAAHTLNIYNNGAENFKKRGKPFQVPPLPSHFVDRPEVTQELKQWLIADRTNLNNTLAISAIKGLGGVGKTILAQALASDKDVQNNFPDGVLWATLGQQPNILSILTDWIINGLGDLDYTPLEEDHASRHLMSLLEDKKILLIVDDVWSPEHFNAFRVARNHCQILVTTREVRILDADRHELDIMTQEQALNLILNITNNNIKTTNLNNSKPELKISQSEQKKIKTFAAIVGYLPLALELGAAQVVEGLSWDDLILDLEGEIADLEALDLLDIDEINDENTRKKHSLVASFNLSLKRLSQDKLEKFAWLGVLPEDVTITQAMASTLWDSKPRKARDLLRTLRAKALLLDGVPYKNTPTYRLHDLVHDFACNLLVYPTIPKEQGNLPGLGLTLVEANKKFLKLYQKQTTNQLWHSLDDDGYIYDHLTWHMKKAECVDSIHQLLREENESGQNGWYSVCENLGKTAIFLTDVTHALKLAEHEFESNPGMAVGLQLRYALIVSSLNTISSKIPSKLFNILVNRKVWTPSQGLVYANQIQYLPQRVVTLSELSSYFPDVWTEVIKTTQNIKKESSQIELIKILLTCIPDNCFPQILNVAQSIENKINKAEALTAIASRFPEASEEALGATFMLNDPNHIHHESFRASNLTKIVPNMSENLLSICLDAARSMKNNWNRAKLLIAIASRLPHILPEALDATLSINCQQNSGKGEYLNNIMPGLSENQQLIALKNIISIDDEFYRAINLVHLPANLNENLLSICLDAARSIKENRFRAEVLIAIASRLPDILPEALEATRSVDDLCNRASLLSLIAPKLPHIWTETLEVTRNINDSRSKTEILKEIAPKLPKELLPVALEIAYSTDDDPTNVSNFVAALYFLAPYLPANMLSQVLETAKNVKKRREYRKNYVEPLISQIFPNLPEKFIRPALESILEVGDESQRVHLLIAIAPNLPEIWLEVLNLTRTIRGESERECAIRSFATSLPEDLFPIALEIALAFKDECYRATSLCSIVPRLSEKLLPQVLEAARKIEFKYSRAELLIHIASRLPYLWLETLELIKTIENEESRSGLFFYTNSNIPENLLPFALEVAYSIDSGMWRSNAITYIVKYHPNLLNRVLDHKDSTVGVNLSEVAKYQSTISPLLALEIALKIQPDGNQVDVLCYIAPHLPENVLPQLLEKAFAFKSEQNQAAVISAIGSRLPKNLLPQVIDTALVFENKYYTIKILSAIATDLPENILYQIVDTASTINDREKKSQILCVIARYLPDIWTEALNNVLDIENEYSKVELLTSIVHNLPDNLLPKVLELARSLSDLEKKAQLFSMIAPRLPEISSEALKAIYDSSKERRYLNILIHNTNLLYSSFPYPLWCKITYFLTYLNREDMLKITRENIHIIKDFGGLESLKEIADAVTDIGRWFP